MDIGLDSFSLHPLNLDAAAQLEWTHAHGFAGIQLGDVAHLAAGAASPLVEIRSHADDLGLYTHVSVGGCNPFFCRQTEADLAQALGDRVRLAARFGWHELHGVLGGPDERAGSPVSWPEQLAASARVLSAAAPILRDSGSRVNLETHGDATTFELVRLAEEVSPDVLGICLDTANVVLQGEHPTEAARRAAPYTHLTHCKDCILYPTDNGMRRQTLPAGTGILVWEDVVGALAACQPELKLSIEDHKWLFDAEVYTPAWMRLHPDSLRDEVLALLGMARQCGERIARRELRNPEEYEQVPYGEEMEDRLVAGRDHLRSVTARLGV